MTRDWSFCAGGQVVPAGEHLRARRRRAGVREWVGTQGGAGSYAECLHGVSEEMLVFSGLHPHAAMRVHSAEVCNQAHTWLDAV
jgi:hypothetical protein